MLKAIVLFSIALVVCFCGSAPVKAQYQLTEIGLTGGLGLALPYRSNNTRHYDTGLAVPATFYVSHWVCGKRWGYQFDVGLNYASQYQHIPFTPSPTDFTKRMPDARLNAFWLHSSASFKIRANNYHRPREMCLIFGPVIHTKLWSQVAYDRYSLKKEQGGGYVFRAGGQAGLWMRFPNGKRFSWFLIPGFELLTPYEMRAPCFPTAYIMDFWQPSLRAGFTLQNSR